MPADRHTRRGRSGTVENVVTDLGPKFLQQVHGHAQRDLLGAVAQHVPCDRIFAGKPRCGDRRRRVIAQEICHVGCRMAPVVVGQQTVNDSVQGSPLGSVLVTRNVANVLVQHGRDGRLKSALQDGAGGARCKPPAMAGKAASQLPGRIRGLIKHQSRQDRARIRAVGTSSFAPSKVSIDLCPLGAGNLKPRRRPGRSGDSRPVDALCPSLVNWGRNDLPRPDSGRALEAAVQPAPGLRQM